MGMANVLNEEKKQQVFGIVMAKGTHQTGRMLTIYRGKKKGQTHEFGLKCEYLKYSEAMRS